MKITGMLTTLLFSTQLVVAQPDSILNKIMLEVNTGLKGSLLRGTQETISVSVQGGNIKMSEDGEEIVRQVLDDVLNSYSGGLLSDGHYNCQVYFDAHSDNVYTSFYMPPAIDSGVFVDYTEWLPETAGGMAHLLETIYSDLYRRKEEAESIHIDHWLSGFTWLIDTTGKIELLGNNPLHQYLDSAIRIPWAPLIYHGSPTNAIIEIRIDRASALVGKRQKNPWKGDGMQYYMKTSPEKYIGDWVPYTEYQRDARGKTVVSFLFDPRIQRLENPLIHLGSPMVGKPFIEWLQHQEWPPNLFYWSEHPQARRWYFSLYK